MFNIAQVIVGGSPSPYSVVGGTPGSSSTAPSKPFGPQGSVYRLILPNFGYITFTDVGPNTQGGPGDWAVNFQGGNGLWTYGGEGNAIINIDPTGKMYNVSGGPGASVIGPVHPW